MDNSKQGNTGRSQENLNVNDGIRHEDNRATAMDANPDYDVTLSGLPNSAASQGTRESDIQMQTHPGAYNDPALSTNLFETDGSGGERGNDGDLGGNADIRGQANRVMQQAGGVVQQATGQARQIAQRAGGYARSNRTATTLLSVGLVAATGYLIARGMSRRTVTRRTLRSRLSQMPSLSDMAPSAITGNMFSRNMRGGKGYLKGLAAGRTVAGSVQDNMGNMRDYLSDRMGTIRGGMAGGVSMPALGSRLAENVGMAKGFLAGLRSKL